MLQDKLQEQYTSKVSPLAVSLMQKACKIGVFKECSQGCTQMLQYQGDLQYVIPFEDLGTAHI